VSDVDPRPLLHITPETGWLNDANGLIHHHGRYHVFHQANPRGLWFGTMEWGHVSSADLVDWTRHPTAIAPSDGPDAGGSWSGCIVFDGDRPTAVYTGVESIGTDKWTQTVCTARGDDELIEWQKDPHNPVIAGPPPGVDAIGFRDPFLRQDGARWSMILGMGGPSGRGGIVQFHSDDLQSWTYDGPIFERAVDETDPISTGRIFECPQLVRLGGRDLLVFSVWDDQRPPVLHYAVTVLGHFDGQTFQADRIERFDYGSHCYAPALLTDPTGRVLAWGWSWEGLTEAGRARQGWAGCLTFPRELYLRDDGHVGVRPAAELATARGIGGSAGNLVLRSGEPWTADGLAGDSLEVIVRFASIDADAVSAVVRASPDGAERTVVRFDRTKGRLEVDRTAASRSQDAIGGVSAAPLQLAGESLELRLLLDRSVIEIFANERISITERIYPSRPDSVGVELIAEGGSARVADVRWWSLAPRRADG
jgi:beta-fructofuranosidase